MPDSTASLRELAHSELARLCESDALRRSPSHVRLLRYLVERALERDRTALTETAIAIAVFHRDPDVYDAQVDPIVRVSVGRLRARLDTCYAAAAGPRALRIAVPRGRYVPEFVQADCGARPRAKVAVLHMRNASGHAQHAAFCRQFAASLVDALGRAGERVLAPAVRSPGRDGGSALAGAPAAEALLDSVLTTDHGGDLRITVRWVDAVDRHVRWIETAADALQARATLGRRVVARVLARVAASGGPSQDG